MKTLPILDFSLLSGSPAEAERFRADLRQVTHDVGFFYLTGHGIPDEVFDRAIQTARAFFALPDADKLAIENTFSPHFRGYTRVGGELTQGKVDWREQIDIGAERPAIPVEPETDDFWVLQGPNLWPEALPQLREFAEEWIDRLNAISLDLLAAWAESLGAPRDFFDPAFAHPPSPLMKIVRYPGKDSDVPVQGVGAHKDLGVLTLLYVEDGKGGLQVEMDGEWIDAPPIPRAFVVNIGEMLEIATNGYLKATNHRVIAPKAGDERISIPFFYCPALDAEIPAITLPAELAAESRGITRDPANELYPVFGRNWLKSRVRAHPNVVEAHHPHLLPR
ncbi:isopenicillin N synthase-like dioxygenase [Microbacteriaceae bacterium MWH-Ta3]|nr:isopenicillin N synthase-like dioxygenase [Microbacteriaceae bacterium MWH-Ta3]